MRRFARLTATMHAPRTLGKRVVAVRRAQRTPRFLVARAADEDRGTNSTVGAANLTDFRFGTVRRRSCPCRSCVWIPPFCKRLPPAGALRLAN